MNFVYDSSATLAACFEDEQTEAVLALLERAGNAEACVPSHWPMEVQNGLMMAERRQRIDIARRRALSRHLRDIPVMIDEGTMNLVWTVTSELAEKHKLTLYDAAYLELALRLNLPLASLDKELRAAGDAAGVTLLGM